MGASIQTDLTPAPLRPEFGRASYAPRIRWKIIAVLVVVVGGAYLAHRWQQVRRADAFRSTILRTYATQLAPTAQRAYELGGRIEQWAQEAAQRGSPPSFIAEDFDWLKLRESAVLYLRLRPEEATSAAKIRKASAGFERDGIASCLGIDTASLKSFYARMAFLDPEGLERLRHTEDMWKLRVHQDELKRRAERDMPALQRMLTSRYVWLVLQNGIDRRQHPVDVFVWRLPEGRLVLRTRIDAEGSLLHAHIGSGRRTSNADNAVSSNAATNSAQDCAIAAALKNKTARHPVASVKTNG